MLELYHWIETAALSAVLDRARSGRRRSIRDAEQGRRSRNVAGLGESLYTDHLVTVELAGALAVRRPDRGGRDHQPQAADPPRRADRSQAGDR